MTRKNEPRRRRGSQTLISFLLLLLAGPALSNDAFVARVDGEIEIGRGEPPAWRPISAGQALEPGDRVRTGRDGRAELVWQGATIRVYGDSMLRMPSVGTPKGVDLEGGSSLFDVDHREDESFEVRTPDVVVSVKGTRFGVAQGTGSPEVSVYRGTVGVRESGRSAREVMVREGFRAVGGIGGPAEIFLLDHPDPWKDWNDWIEQPLPRTARTSPPARLADDAAHRSVQREARSRALTLAMKRNPELVDRLVEVRAKMNQAVDRSEKTEDLGEPADLLAAVDPLLDAPAEDVDRALRSQFIEEVLNAPGSSLDVTLTRAGEIEIVDSDGGQTWQLDEDMLVDILEGGSTLPTGLDAALGVDGMEDQVEVVTVLLGLLGR